jgi:hypothetical protein
LAESRLPYHQLLSVLFSTFPLTEAVAMTLYEAAFELHRTGASRQKVAGDILSGTVKNLKKHAMLGPIGGPTFEAEVETARGKGTVQFLLTRTGLEAQGLVDVPKEQRN